MQNQLDKQYIHDFVATAARNVRVAAAIDNALRTMEVLNLAELEVVGRDGKLDFSHEILKLRAALSVMGVDDKDEVWRLARPAA